MQHSHTLLIIKCFKCSGFAEQNDIMEYIVSFINDKTLQANVFHVKFIYRSMAFAAISDDTSDRAADHVRRATRGNATRLSHAGHTCYIAVTYSIADSTCSSKGLYTQRE